MLRNPFRQAAIRVVPSFHHEHPSYRWWVLINVMVATFMSVLMSTIVNGALPSMMTSLGVNLDMVQWVITAYLLVFSVMLPLSAWLAERFGFKLIYLLALCLFTLGSFLCFISWDFSSLIVSRLIQGAGGGIIMPLGMAMITREFPAKQRGLAMGFWAIASAASSSLGPSIGGYLIDNFSWRATFLINVPVGIVAVFATLVIQREFRHDEKKDFDFKGFTAIAVFLISLLLALTDGNAAWNIQGWSAPFIILCLVLAVISLAAFIYIELTSKSPLVDLRLLKMSTFSLSNGVMFFFFLSLMGSTFLLPLYFQNVLGYSALQSGMMFLPLGIMQAICSPLSGMIGTKFGFKIPVVIGIAFLGASLLMNTMLDQEPSAWLITVPIFLRGIAFGLIFTPLQVIAVSGLAPHQLAQGSSLINLIRQVGGSFGVAIFGLILSQRNIFNSAVYGEGMDSHGSTFLHTVGQLSHVIVQSSGVSLENAKTIASALIIQNAAKDAYIRAICDVFFIVAILSIACVIPVILMKDENSLKRAKK